MSLEQIIENNENKIIFLKAILLGITYGKKENSEYYKENIEKEIEKLNINKNIEKEKEIVNNRNIRYSINLDSSEELPIYAKIKNNENKIIIKYNNILKNLENQKQYTINLIKNLSETHYGYNYSKINLLKTNLQFINNEIDKNKNFFKKELDQQNIIFNTETKDRVIKKINNYSNLNNINNIDQNKINRISPSINFSSKNTNIIKNSMIKNNNLELDYKIDNLSKLLIN